MAIQDRQIITILAPPEPMWEVRAMDDWGEPSYHKIHTLMYCHSPSRQQDLQRHFPQRPLSPMLDVFYTTSVLPDLPSAWTQTREHGNDARGRCYCKEQSCRIVGVHQGDKFSPDDRTWQAATARAQLLNKESAKRDAISAKAKAKREAKKAETLNDN
jgi:hypothetical protein